MSRWKVPVAAPKTLRKRLTPAAAAVASARSTEVPKRGSCDVLRCRVLTATHASCGSFLLLFCSAEPPVSSRELPWGCLLQRRQSQLAAAFCHCRRARPRSARCRRQNRSAAEAPRAPVEEGRAAGRLRCSRSANTVPACAGLERK